MNIGSIINELRTGGTTVTIEGTDYTMREAAIVHDEDKEVPT